MPYEHESRRLRVGLPSKGRLADQAIALLQQAGLSFRRLDRSLFARARELPVDITFLRTGDIPILCQEGAIDLGITGGDIVEECRLERLQARSPEAGPTEFELSERLRLGIGKCRLALCVPEDSTWSGVRSLDRRRIATTFPRITASYFSNLGMRPHLVSLSGSVEIMVQLEVADAIVDLVETGSTLAANRLKVLEEIGSYETIVVQGPSVSDVETAERLLRRLEGVVIANAYSLLEYNVPRAKLGEAERITPGFQSPTVSALEDPAWCAVRAMVKKSELVEVMERLDQIGAVAILETRIQNCRL